MPKLTDTGLYFLAWLAAAGALPTMGQILNEDRKLIASDGVLFDLFGHSIAIDGGIVAVGASQNDDYGFSSGAAYLFDATTGSELHKLLPDDGAADDNFGISIGIDGGIVVVGTFIAVSGAVNPYAAYLFDANTGAQLHKLLPEDGQTGRLFGFAVAIDSGVVVVGAWGDSSTLPQQGSAYLFDAATGEQLFKLKPGTESGGDNFGFAVDIDDGIVAIGAYRDDDLGFDAGAAYLFDAVTGSLLYKLLPDDGAAGDEFGRSIAIDNGVVAVGAIRDDDDGTDSGSVYLFDAATGTQLWKLLADDGAEFKHLGYSVAINHGTVAAGAWISNDNGSGSGSAYLFDAAAGTQLAKLLPSDGTTDERFGTSVAVGGDLATVGAYFGNTVHGSQTGSAFVFTAPAAPCIADVNGDGVLSPADFSAWVAAFNAGTPACDQNGDGSCTPADFSAWVANYNAGC